MKQHLFNDEGRLRSFVNVYVNDEDIRYLQKDQTPLKSGDTVSIIPSVAGGARRRRRPSERRASAAAAARADEVRRYSRHLILPEVGMDGQRTLKAAKVLCIGAGGLGSPAAMYLAAAGVGTLGIVDFDVVDMSNLQRQMLHGTPDVGRSKLASAKDRLHALNPERARRNLRDRAQLGERAASSSSRTTSILDGTDNFPTRYLVNDACVLLGQAERVRQHLPLRGAGVGVRRRRTARAIAACIRSRRRPDWCRAAPKAGCWACCRASSARFRRPKRSS